jgi:hypothetical protein
MIPLEPDVVAFVGPVMPYDGPVVLLLLVMSKLMRLDEARAWTFRNRRSVPLLSNSVIGEHIARSEPAIALDVRVLSRRATLMGVG